MTKRENPNPLDYIVIFFLGVILLFLCVTISKRNDVSIRTLQQKVASDNVKYDSIGMGRR